MQQEGRDRLAEKALKNGRLYMTLKQWSPGALLLRRDPPRVSGEQVGGLGPRRTRRGARRPAAAATRRWPSSRPCATARRMTRCGTTRRGDAEEAAARRSRSRRPSRRPRPPTPTRGSRGETARGRSPAPRPPRRHVRPAARRSPAARRGRARTAAARSRAVRSRPRPPAQARSPGDAGAHAARAARRGPARHGLRPVDDRTRSPGPSYTVDTLEAFTRCSPGARLFLLVGADSLEDLPGWRDPERILALATVAVAARPGTPARRPAARLLARHSGAIAFLGNPPVDVSSTRLRARVAAGRSIRFLVPAAVERTIERLGLYRRAGEGEVMSPAPPRTPVPARRAGARLPGLLRVHPPAADQLARREHHRGVRLRQHGDQAPRPGEARPLGAGLGRARADVAAREATPTTRRSARPRPTTSSPSCRGSSRWPRRSACR